MRKSCATAAGLRRTSSAANNNANRLNFKRLALIATMRRTMTRVGPPGLERPASSSEETALSKKGDAQSDARGLADILAALSPELRAAVEHELRKRPPHPPSP